MAVGVFVAADIPSQCAHCGHAYLLLVVLGDGVVRRIRIGCRCHSVRVNPTDTDRALRARLRREFEAAVTKRTAS